MSLDPNQTGASTDSSVNPAQNPAPNPAPTSFTLTNPPTNSYSAVDPNLIANYEQRVRALMSEKDRTRAEYEKAVSERLQLQQKLDELTGNQQNVISAAAK